MAFAFLSKLFSSPQTKRVRTPTVIQMEAVECGAAALGIILGYHRRIVPLPELRRECGVSRDGSKASNVLKAARIYGLNAKGFKKSLEEVQKLPPPYIVFWNFNHFLVVEGFVKNKVYLNDPASGPRSITLEEFDQGFTGVVLVFEPGADFTKGGKKQGIIPALTARLQNSHAAILFCLLTGLFLTIPRLAVPAFTQVFIDEVIVEGRQDWLKPLLLVMLFAVILIGVLARLRLTYLRRLMLKLSISMSGQFLWHTLRLPIGFYAQRYAGEISNRSQLNQKVANILSGQLATTIIDTVMIVFYALIMFLYDWVLTIMVIFFAAINFVALRYLARTRLDANARLAQESGKVAGVAIGGIMTIETVKAAGLESDLFSKFAGYYSKMVNAQQELSLPSQVLSSIPSLLTSLATTAILVVGGFRVMNGNLSIGMLIAYQALTQSFLSPVNNLLNFGSTLQELEADLGRLDDVLANPIDTEVERGEQVETETNTQLATVNQDNFKLKGYIELRNISFGYSRLEPPLISNFSLSVKPGQRVALVGGSGSGKSTVAKLVTGLYAPWEGEILFDGIPRTRLSRAVLANSLAMVEQEIFLFAGLVRDNLTLWDSTVPEEYIIQACEDAAIHDLILAMPGGYEGELIEGGMNMSGGQRQRLEIARALVRNPSILVLDEATSALDAETELIIDRNLRRRGCSCVVVAHRLSTIRDCDEIIVLDRGKVVQRGTHEELREQGGIYAQLTSSQETEEEEQEQGVLI
ncbi:NHLP family bacteriocin export ABC transporter peptidase/permease/ATPase subunit [Cyanobacterium aponinum UTEX 3221]|uniref:NHLP family bacteriocin export ABC transporter peptidase/permease/ATPase subunit n=1 Tax=Cyanobacterium aponinum TaxID=379064 RepID=UPI002B4BAC59|nr:NHLP family bacteriocin export ABC transporter peptidase/permease/ATPase subunit [Cyanobacterium aponinum]WRL38257.1 NHLP family bacteriocin export ABC transporter peptidase/permease/ATPase subunit [Cyanobacterium aponinum UTEX 3221]